MSHPIKSQKHIPAMVENLTILHKTLFKIKDLKVRKERSRVEDPKSHAHTGSIRGESNIDHGHG